jgi:hypothetical protein
MWMSSKMCSLMLIFVSAKRNLKDSVSAQNIIIGFHQEYSRYRFTIGKIELRI